MKVRNPNKIRTYVLQCDRGLNENEQTIFHYTPASLEAQYNSLDDSISLTKDENGKTVTNVKLNKGKEISLLLNCIVKIDRLFDEDNQPLVWKTVDAEHNKKILAVIPGECRIELAEVIRTGQELRVDDIKN